MSAKGRSATVIEARNWTGDWMADSVVHFVESIYLVLSVGWKPSLVGWRTALEGWKLMEAGSFEF